MLIGTFVAVDQGYVGYIQTLSFGRQSVVLIPVDERNASYDVLFVNADNQSPIKFGSARRCKEKAREYLKLSLDCPGLPAPLEAVMPLKATREGAYRLEWERKPPRARRRK